MSLICISRRNEISLMCIKNYTLFPLPLSRVNRLFINVIESEATLTWSFGNMLGSIVVALYRFIPIQRRESSAGFIHYYTWSRIWVWAAGPSFRTNGTVASPGITSLVSWRSMGFPSFSTLVWCPILTTLRWTSFTWVTRLPDTLHEMKFEVLTLDCNAVQFSSVLRSFNRSYHIYQSISFRTVDSQYFFFLFGIFGKHRISEMSVKVIRLHGVTSKKANWITLQPNAIVFRLLYFCRQLYMFRALTHNQELV